MSLRYQINLRILFSSAFVLLLVGCIVIWQAHKAVNEEIESSIHLALQLISFTVTHSTEPPEDWLAEFKTLKKTRHLSIQLLPTLGKTQSLPPQNTAPEISGQPPLWFINLVAGEQLVVNRSITTANGQMLNLIIQANPLDEITEVWEESIAFLSAFFLLTLLSFLAVNLAFYSSVKTISQIINVLQVIETGKYQQKLPLFDIAEYGNIARAINSLIDKLTIAEQENRVLTQHSLEIQEDERQRLAQELHDELGQSLTAIKIMVIASTRSKNHTFSSEALTTIIQTCDHLMTVVRSMMHSLHPLVLTELGLKASLEDLLNHWAMRTSDLKITLNCPDEINALEAKIAIQIFRIVQECLTNMVRHAQATQATISLSLENKQLHLQVIDNGQGCLLPLKNTGEEKMGFGLLGMRERISSLGGELSLVTASGEGLCVNVSIPL